MVQATQSLLIVYHSMTGAARQMAFAAAQGARAAGEVEVALQTAVDTLIADVLKADGYIFITPENLAAMSGLMKDFFDRTYYPALEKLNGRPYAALIAAGSDGRNAAQQIARIALGWRLKAIAEPMIVCTQASTPEQILSPKQLTPAQLTPCSELGSTLASGLALGIF